MSIKVAEPAPSLGPPRPGPRIPRGNGHRRRRSLRLRGDRLVAVVVLAPSVLAIAIFIYAFIIWTGYISTMNWVGLEPNYIFIGLRNFVQLFEDQRFLIDLRNLLLFGSTFILQCLVVGFILASLLNNKVKAEALFRTIYILPFAISAVVTGVVWHWLMQPGAGIDQVLSWIGLGAVQPDWYTNSTWGILSVSVAAAWQMSGYVMALYLAGLRSIPQEALDAAAIDGARTWQIYRHIIIPLLKPVTYTAIVITGMLSIRLFDLIASMTSSGPNYSDDSLAYYMYQLAFSSSRFGASAAIAVVMMVIALALLLPYLRHLRKGES